MVTYFILTVLYLTISKSTHLLILLYTVCVTVCCKQNKSQMDLYVDILIQELSNRNISKSLF